MKVGSGKHSIIDHLYKQPSVTSCTYNFHLATPEVVHTEESLGTHRLDEKMGAIRRRLGNALAKET